MQVAHKVVLFLKRLWVGPSSGTQGPFRGHRGRVAVLKGHKQASDFRVRAKIPCFPSRALPSGFPKAPSSSIVSTWDLKGSPCPSFGLEVWTMMVLGAFGLVSDVSF